VLRSPDVAVAAPRAERPRPTAGIAGLGAALPARAVANDQIAAGIGVDSEWIERRTGIRSRRHAAPDVRLSDLAARAAELALRGADMRASELDLVLVATLSQERRVPNAAPLVAHAIGATRAGAVDVGAACTGFVSGLALAAAYVESGRAANVLLVGAELLSRHTNLADRRTAGLFGDGAGAVVVGAGAPGWIGPVVMAADGAAAELITADPDSGLIAMDGHETFKRAVVALAQSTRDAVLAAGMSLGDVDRFVLHQANGRILTAVASALDLEPERVVDAIADVGNTSAASIPLALAECAPRAGERLVLGAVGSGLTWGACVVEWGSA
jgi:3-oxoacyl-[acyl-carrier-protein] synthase III